MSLKENLKSVYHWARRVKKSYSQTGEDIIAQFYLSEIKNGFYVDVGANDPVYMNNTYRFYKNGWRGLNIEPNINKCKIIRAVRRKDDTLNLGVGQNPGMMEFYIFDPDTLSTFSKEASEKYQRLGHKLVGTAQVQVLPLGQILEKYAGGKTIDLLSVDTEGWNLEVLKSNNWEKFRPKLIIAEVVEYQRQSSVRQELEFTVYLREHGYAKLADTYINAIYIEKDYAFSKKLS